VAEPLTLELVEGPDGIVGPESGSTRASFLKLGGVALTGTFLAGFAAEEAEAQSPAAQRATDLRVLGAALLLEQLGAAFYGEALRRAGLRGETRRYAQTLLRDERAHVGAVSSLIRRRGGRPARAPRFNFRGTTSSSGRFLRTSVLLEETDVGALNGAGPLVSEPVLIAAGALVSVEARHVAWGLDLLGRRPAPRAFDAARTLNQTVARVRRTGFVRG